MALGKSPHFTYLYLRNDLLSLSPASWVFWKMKALKFKHATRMVVEISDIRDFFMPLRERIVNMEKTR